MKHLIIIFIPFLFACTGKYDLYVDLSGSVIDHELHFYNEKIKDSKNNYSVRRIISLNYRAVNESPDTIFIPVGFPFVNPLSANVLYSDSLHIEFTSEGCSKTNGQMQGRYAAMHFAPKDTFWLSLSLSIDPKNNIDNEWLKKVSTKELVSKIHINMTKTIVEDCTHEIPNIIFNNDTNNININPIICPKKIGNDEEDKE